MKGALVLYGASTAMPTRESWPPRSDGEARWQLRDGITPIAVPADRLSIVMTSEAPMTRLHAVLQAVRQAHYVCVVFVSPHVERMERPFLGGMDRHNPTGAIAWMSRPPKHDPGADTLASTMDLADYSDYGAFIRELVERRRAGMQVVIGPL